jgi:hypothetical protein
MTAAPEPDRERLRLVLAAEWPAKVNAERNGENVVLSREGRGDRVEGVLGKKTGPVWLTAGDTTLSLTVFQTGSAVAQRDRSHTHFLTFNKSDDAERVQDILTALAWVNKPSAELTCTGMAATWCTFAAAVAPMKVKVAGLNAEYPSTDEDYLKNFFVPGILRIGGVKTATALAAR